MSPHHEPPWQLIYGGKTKQSLPRFKFPDSFSLSVNPTHCSNEEESIKFIENIIVPYVEEQRSLLELPNQNALVLLDVFTGQTRAAVLKTFKDNGTLLVFVPANMTHIFQPLDLSVNAFAKRFTKDKFNKWYTDQIIRQM